MNVTFYGVRGSTPCACIQNQRYGGNTACVAIDFPGADPIVFDLGTGLRFWGEAMPAGTAFHGHALVTHLHWDHVQGLPFFGPILSAGSTLDIYACPQETSSLAGAFDEFMGPPYFPVRVSDLPGELRFHEVDETEFAIGDVRVVVRRVPHIGPTNGYRVERDGVSVVYVSDHQQPLDGSFDIPDGVLELCDGADLLIHDAQYTDEDFAEKATWGHCTVDYALAVATRSGARRLALFHHDPGHDDATVDAIVSEARLRVPRSSSLEIVAAAEGLTMSLGAVAASSR